MPTRTLVMVASSKARWQKAHTKTESWCRADMMVWVSHRLQGGGGASCRGTPRPQGTCACTCSCTCGTCVSSQVEGERDLCLSWTPWFSCWTLEVEEVENSDCRRKYGLYFNQGPPGVSHSLPWELTFSHPINRSILFELQGQMNRGVMITLAAVGVMRGCRGGS